MEIVLFKGNRWQIVDEEGKTLDDALGYGFKTADGARKCWQFKQHKNTKESVKAYKKGISKWWNEHRELYSYIQDQLFINLKDGEPLKQYEAISLARKFMIVNHIEDSPDYELWQLVRYEFF